MYLGRGALSNGKEKNQKKHQDIDFSALGNTCVDPNEDSEAMKFEECV